MSEEEDPNLVAHAFALGQQRGRRRSGSSGAWQGTRRCALEVAERDDAKVRDDEGHLARQEKAGRLDELRGSRRLCSLLEEHKHKESEQKKG